MRMRQRRVLGLLSALVSVVVAASSACGGTTVSTRDGGDPPGSTVGTTSITVSGTIPRTSTTKVPGTNPGTVPRTTIPRSTIPTTTPTTTPRSTTTVGPKAGREAATQELAEHRAIWDAKHPVAYRFKIGVGCFCPSNVTGPFIITARVDTREIQNVNPDAGAPSGESPPDVEGAFKKAKDALATADEVEIRYDEAWGFPTLIDIDWIKNAVDDEESLTISEFEVL